MQARREGLVPSEAMCDMLLLAILKRIRAGKLIAGTAAWIPKAVYVYRECIVAGARGHRRERERERWTGKNFAFKPSPDAQLAGAISPGRYIARR
jgi:hypothetical protein